MNVELLSIVSLVCVSFIFISLVLFFENPKSLPSFSNIVVVLTHSACGPVAKLSSNRIS